MAGSPLQTSGRGNRVAARTCGRLLNLVYICRSAQKNVQKSAVTHKIEWEMVQKGKDKLMTGRSLLRERIARLRARR
ncbi:hypothetical protein BME69_13965 [Klebsiella quasipneumoniae subsp. quasipneumoniae]|nr:hypothetical protein BME69_13965 [Klebsiella quasipneumoniae subsp. quasipneumoniae]PLC69384.1 hypothetical protein B6I39_26680 [Klebsiella quasipneumoniae]PLL67404.1 hypothetical protein CWN76_28075 [Klebsiella quasipneumoniae]